MIKSGQRVFVDFGTNSVEGLCVQDCEDWGSEPLIVRDDDGETLTLYTWLAHDLEVIDS
jgi:hypothetical protein